jgi:hypothetical protein
LNLRVVVTALAFAALYAAGTLWPRDLDASVVTGASAAAGALGAWGVFPLLGIFPGVALATFFPLERNALARWTLGLAVSPLVAAVAAWVAMRCGLSLPAAARAVAIVSALSWLASEWWWARGERLRGAGTTPEPGMRFAWAWALGSASVIAFVLFVNPYLQVRADAWIHAGIVHEILERGIPPQDPRFAGLSLNYVWFYNYFIALSSSLRGDDPFALMASSNVASMFATMGCAWLVTRRIWDSPRAAAGATILTGLSFNAGMWILWPLRLLQAFSGDVRGAEEVARIVHDAHWNDATVIYALSPMFTHMVNFLDKPLHGTAINVAYVLMALYLWAMVRALADGCRSAPAWGAVATLGMHLFHGVVGLSVVPAALGALGLAWLFAPRAPWLPKRGRLVAFAFATALGTLLAAPYVIEISRAWPAAESGVRHSYLQFDPRMALTLLTALAVPAWFARRSIGKLVAERRAGAAMIALFTACMLAFSLAVTLPIGSHAKFVLEVFAGLVALGGVAFHDEIASWRRRFGLPGAVVIAALLLGTPLLTLHGYLSDRSRTLAPEHPLQPGEEALYAWIRTATPPDAVFVDAGYRDVIMVAGRRQLWLGSREGPELAAFPLGPLLERRAVLADLSGAADSLERDADALRALGRPAYVVARPPASATPQGAGTAAIAGARIAPVTLDARPDLFERVRVGDGFAVYSVRPAALP